MNTNTNEEEINTRNSPLKGIRMKNNRNKNQEEEEEEIEDFVP